MTARLDTIRVGFIPLLDCAPLIVAHETGIAAEEGLALDLHKETSWATLRDRLAVGHLDAGHSLAPMPIAAKLGLAPLASDLVVPMALCSGGNTITIAERLWLELADLGAPEHFDARATLTALAALIARHAAAGLPRLTFGIVHAHSAHHYELAYWLAAGGIRPGVDIDLVAVPPSLMAAALASGRIQGFCAGEPWGTAAVSEGAGRILITNAHIWTNSPEKVLGVRAAWAQSLPEVNQRLIRAVYRAALWCDAPANQDTLAILLKQPGYVGRPREQIAIGLSRCIQSPGGSREPVEGFLNFAGKAQTFPWVSHALWFYSQMVRWGQATLSPQAVAATRATYRPEMYRAALGSRGITMPAANSKLEGALTAETPVGSTSGRLVLGPDTFFDGRVFDPEDIVGYLASLRGSDPSAPSPAIEG
ncbi:MAG: CmpA/NrtA family ABC transporter substrate-binding protein [Hyphomicrobiaceae bacterium]|nr:CmpA/NrtA family ABC transporter substrate-binding protein [Hyphomicrobiaceae bacterium]